MPPRSVKMKRRILGFQRRVWWPKWTPASSSSRMETTDMCIPFGWISLLRRGAGGTGIRQPPAPPPVAVAAGSGFGGEIVPELAPRPFESGGEIRRKAGFDVDPLPGDRGRAG